MDVDETGDEQRCFEIQSPVSYPLNLVYNTSSPMVIFWNKYQILVYENLNFTHIANIQVPEFDTHDLILSNNYLVCLDCIGNIHVTSLKFKNAVQKRMKSSFQVRETNITTFEQYYQDYTLSIKERDDSLFLCLHKINSEFQLCRKIQLKLDFNLLPVYRLQEKSIIRCYPVPENNNEYFEQITQNISKGSILIIVTFDSKTIYSCVFNEKMLEEKLCLTTLYSCPSEICGIQIIDLGTLNVIIALKSGSIIKLPFESNVKVPQIIHLNIAIHKFLAFEDAIVYTNGNTLWKSENTYSKHDMKLKQLVVKNGTDFVKFGDQIICVTSSNQIHLLPIENENTYVKSLGENDFYAAEDVLRNSDYFDEIMLEISKADEIARKSQKESYYVGAMALANRQDVMEGIIQYYVHVYENYEDALNENSNLSLTNKINEYFDLETMLFLIKIKVSEQHKVNNVISSLLEDLKLHISFLSDCILQKTVSITIKEVMKDMNILIPLKYKSITNITLKIKLVPGLPGALDEDQKIWIILSKKEITLNCEHFIKSSLSNKNIMCLKNPQENLEDLILQSARNHHGNLYNFSSTSRIKTDGMDWLFYIKLPEDYARKLSNKDSYDKSLNKIKADFLHKRLSSNDFLLSKTQLNFQIQDEKVKVQITEDDFSGILLKISSQNIKVGHSMRNFLSGVLYGSYASYEPGKEFIPQAQYAIIEDLQRSLKSCIAERSLDEEKIINLAEQFQKNVLGSLP